MKKADKKANNYSSGYSVLRESSTPGLGAVFALWEVYVYGGTGLVCMWYGPNRRGKAIGNTSRGKAGWKLDRQVGIT